MNEERLIELETKISHQEVAIEELQQALFDQHLAFEKLEKNFKHLTERIEAIIGGGHEVGPGNQKPPHY